MPVALHARVSKDCLAKPQPLPLSGASGPSAGVRLDAQLRLPSHQDYSDRPPGLIHRRHAQQDRPCPCEARRWRPPLWSGRELRSAPGRGRLWQADARTLASNRPPARASSRRMSWMVGPARRWWPVTFSACTSASGVLSVKQLTAGPTAQRRRRHESARRRCGERVQ